MHSGSAVVISRITLLSTRTVVILANPRGARQDEAVDYGRRHSYICGMSLSAGTRLGAFEIIASIGAGGMGEVYKARDTRLERVVAIKVLPEHLAANPERKQRFEREAKAISQLNHPHICTLYDVGRDNGIDCSTTNPVVFAGNVNNTVSTVLIMYVNVLSPLPLTSASIKTFLMMPGVTIFVS